MIDNTLTRVHEKNDGGSDMKRSWVLIGLAVMVLAPACAKKENGSTQKAGEGAGGPVIRVVATIGMISDMVENLGGDRVQVTGLMGPGVDPHLYKASGGDVTRMAKADMVFYNGLHLEGKMAELFEEMARRKRTVAVTDGIDRSLLLAPPEFEGAYDPHVWFDVTLWIKAVEHARDALVGFDPENAALYQQNARTYLTGLRGLHQYVLTMAATVPEEKRVLITAHDAFNYFGRAYGFEVRGLQGISTAAEAGTAHRRATTWEW
jgi:manganese/zinc/iron transport system substrate-binding protein